MSRKIEENVRCPSCQAQSPFTMWASLNVTLDPEQKAPLLVGDLFRFTCPQCSAVAQVVYPMLYHDMERKFMVWLLPADEQTGRAAQPSDEATRALGSLAGYKLRSVRSVNELLEKVLTFDAQLDDLTIEMIKLFIASQMPEQDRADDTEIRFAAVEVDEAEKQHLHFAIVRPGGTTGASVPREPGYSDMQKVVAELSNRKPPPGQWPHIDAQYVSSLMDLGGAGDGGGGAGDRWTAPTPPA